MPKGLTKPGIKAILHDWDDTIVNSFETYIDWYHDFAKQNHLPPVTTGEIRKHWGRYVPHILTSLWPQLHLEMAEELLKRFKPSREFLPVPFSGVPETLLDLYKQGYTLAILSSGVPSNIYLSYQKYIHTSFAYHDIIVAGKLKHNKPDPRVFDVPLEKLKEKGVEESEILYVGDHLLDFQAAKNRNLAFVAVLTGITNREEFIKEGLSEEAILDSFCQLPDLLQR